MEQFDPGAGEAVDAGSRVDLPRATQGVFGLLDVVSPDMIEGWAFDPAAPETPLEVVITVDGHSVWTGRAEMFREDLAQVQVGDGRHAFRCSVEPGWLDSGSEEHVVRAFIPGLDAELRGSPQTLRAPAAPPQVEPAAEAAAAFEAVTAVLGDSAPSPAQARGEPAPPAIFERPRSFVGCLDQVDETSIRGWAFEIEAPGVPVSIDIFDGDALVARVEASRLRDDLRRNGFGDGRHSFFLPTPAWLLDGRRHVVRAVVSNTTRQLQQSPVAVEFAAADPLRTISEIEAALAGLTRSVGALRARLQAASEQSGREAGGVDPYLLWHARHGVLGGADRGRVMAAVDAMWRRPKLSVIMPTCNTKPEFLTAAIRSVQAQLYPDWELCVADDGSEAQTAELLDELTRDDTRIRVVLRPDNGGIAAATNSAVAMATGEYLCFLDHDDALTEDALFQMAVVIERDGPDLVYSDEDKIDEWGRPHAPHFKPDFSHRLLLGYNYMCHLLAVRRTLAELVGPLRSEVDGAQDHDFILRCLERSHPSKVAHVPLVLYHWRTHPGSTAASMQAKSYATNAGIDAVGGHLRRIGCDAAVQPGPGGSYRVTWALPSDRPLVSVVIPTRDQARSLSTCLSGLTRITEHAPIEIVIVDNGSVQPATLDLLREAERDPRVRVVRDDRPFNFSALANLGAANAAGELVLFLNDDIEVIEGGWLSEMVREISQPGVGAVGGKLLYPDGRIQHAGVILGVGGVAGHSHKYFDVGASGYMNRLNMAQEVSACTAACLLVRRGAFEAVGGFDAVNLPVAFNDVDFCLRLREAGYAVVFTPHAMLRHHESVSRGAEDSPAKTLRSGREIAYMLKRWHGVLDADPFYSPNLTLKEENFAIDPARGAPRVKGGGPGW